MTEFKKDINENADLLSLWVREMFEDFPADARKTEKQDPDYASLQVQIRNLLDYAGKYTIGKIRTAEQLSSIMSDYRKQMLQIRDAAAEYLEKNYAQAGISETISRRLKSAEKIRNIAEEGRKKIDRDFPDIRKRKPSPAVLHPEAGKGSHKAPEIIDISLNTEYEAMKQLHHSHLPDIPENGEYIRLINSNLYEDRMIHPDQIPGWKDGSTVFDRMWNTAEALQSMHYRAVMKHFHLDPEDKVLEKMFREQLMINAEVAADPRYAPYKDYLPYIHDAVDMDRENLNDLTRLMRKGSGEAALYTGKNSADPVIAKITDAAVRKMEQRFYGGIREWPKALRMNPALPEADLLQLSAWNIDSRYGQLELMKRFLSEAGKMDPALLDRKSSAEYADENFDLRVYYGELAAAAADMIRDLRAELKEEDRADLEQFALYCSRITSGFEGMKQIIDADLKEEDPVLKEEKISRNHQILKAAAEQKEQMQLLAGKFAAIVEQKQQELVRKERDLWFASLEEKLKQLGFDTDNPYMLAHLVVMQKHRIFEMETDTFEEIQEHFNDSKDTITYAMMEVTEDGKYQVPRPDQGSTMPWLCGNMKNFRNAPDSLKEYLYRMAQENRLFLLETKKGMIFENTLNPAAVDPKTGKILLYPTALELTNTYNDYLPSNSDYENEVSPASCGIPQNIYSNISENAAIVKNGSSKGASRGVITTFLRQKRKRLEAEKNPERRQLLKNQIEQMKTMLEDDPEQIEHNVAAEMMEHPDWGDTEEKLNDLYRFEKVNLVQPQDRDEEDEDFAYQHPELGPRGDEICMRLLKLTGRSSLADVMRSKAVRKLDGTLFPASSSREFLHDLMFYTMEELKPVSIEAAGGIRAVYNVEEHHLDKKYKFERSYLQKDLSAFVADVSAVVKQYRIHIREMYTAVVQMIGDEQPAEYDLVKSLSSLLALQDGNRKREYFIESVPEEMKSGIESLKRNYIQFLKMRNEPLGPEQDRTRLLHASREILSRYALDCPSPASGNNDAEMLRNTQDELQRLSEEMFRTDSRMSSDSVSYRILREELQYNKKFNDSVKLTRDHLKLSLDLIYEECSMYMLDHQKTADLSSRQQQRLKVMSRLMDLHDRFAKNRRQDDPEELLAEKIVQNLAVYQQGVQSSDASVSGTASYITARNLQLNRKMYRKTVEMIRQQPAFKAFAVNKMKDPDAMKTSGRKLLEEYNYYCRKMDENAEKKLLSGQRHPAGLQRRH